MLTKSYKDYLLEAEQSPEPQPGDVVHVVTEDGVESYIYENQLLKRLLKKFTKDKKKGKVKDTAKKAGSAGAGYAAGTGGGILGSLLLGPNKGNANLFKLGYDISSNQFVGKNPVVETLNTKVTQKFSQNISHFVLDLR